MHKILLVDGVRRVTDLTQPFLLLAERSLLTGSTGRAAERVGARA